MNTMNRWIKVLLLAPVLALGLATGHAQETITREAPKDVKLALLTVKLPPQIELDGKPDRLSPGSRIRDTRNFLVLSASLSGKTVPMVYRRDAAGLVHEAWLLTPDEYRKLGGSDSAADGNKRFIELLALIFGARK